MAAYFEPFFPCCCLAESGGIYKLLLYYERNLVWEVLNLCVYVFGDIHLTLPLFDIWTRPSETRRGFLRHYGPHGS